MSIGFNPDDSVEWRDARRIALESALRLLTHEPHPDERQVLAIAEKFLAFLSGEEPQ